jgi:hypothetical protein
MDRRTLALALPLVLGALGAPAGPPAENFQYRDRVYGFSLSPPGYDRADAQPLVQIVAFSGPASGGVAPSLCVQRRKLEGNFDDHVKAREEHFAAQKLTVVSKKPGQRGASASCEWVLTGVVDGHALQLRELAIAHGGEVFALVASTRLGEFEKHDAQFTQAMESFRIGG